MGHLVLLIRTISGGAICSGLDMIKKIILNFTFKFYYNIIII